MCMGRALGSVDLLPCLTLTAEADIATESARCVFGASPQY